MITGIGVDIVQVHRIEAALARHGDHFVNKILGPAERVLYLERYTKRPERGIRFLATRFSAKEAFVKALGQGKDCRFGWHDLQIVNEKNGKPQPLLQGPLHDFMEQHQLVMQVSLTDEVEYVVAFVIVSLLRHQKGD